MPVTKARTLPGAVFHIVDLRNWEAVRREGLRPASKLARDGLSDRSALDLLRNWRAGSETLPGGAVLRDQRPMPQAALERCLHDGLTPADWYELVNEGVYFWADVERLQRHLAAQTGTQILLELDGPALAEAYAPAAFVTAFNVGSARRRPADRGPGTFVPYRSWITNGWTDENPSPRGGRRSSHPPAEFVIRDNIADVMRFVRTILTVESSR